MLWGSPYGGAYMFAEWLLSVIFWLVVLIVVGVLVLRPFRKRSSMRKMIMPAAKSVGKRSRRRKSGSV
jgi:uncharacterized membrane protein